MIADSKVQLALLSSMNRNLSRMSHTINVNIGNDKVAKVVQRSIDGGRALRI